MEQAARTGIAPTLNRNIATIAATESRAPTVDGGEHRHVERQTEVAGSDGSRKNVCSANQIARFRMTPTTAAVIPASAPLSGLLSRSRLDEGGAEADPQEAGDEGAPGRQADRRACRRAAAARSRDARYAAMNPTNCTTMISGPGVVSAMPSPSSISPGRSQP